MAIETSNQAEMTSGPLAPRPNDSITFPVELFVGSGGGGRRPSSRRLMRMCAERYEGEMRRCRSLRLTVPVQGKKSIEAFQAFPRWSFPADGSDKLRQCQWSPIDSLK